MTEETGWDKMYKETLDKVPKQFPTTKEEFRFLIELIKNIEFYYYNNTTSHYSTRHAIEDIIKKIDE